MDEVKLLPCVTKASLQFADGSMVAIDFERGNSIDEALSKLRLASTGEARPPIVTDEAVERVARAICYWHNPKHGSCFDNFCVGSCRAVKPDQEHYDQARAAIAAMPTIDQDGGVTESVERGVSVPVRQPRG